MMRLLFLCLLLLRAAVSEERESSGDNEMDDEDFEQSVTDNNILGQGPSVLDKARGEGDNEDEKFTMMIVIVVAATMLALTVAAVISIMLVRRRMHSRQQGIYSVPTEQDKKGDI